jgi:hypothetical protein
MRLQVQGAELIEADDHVGVAGPGLRVAVGDGVERQHARLLGLEVGIVLSPLKVVRR